MDHFRKKKKKKEVEREIVDSKAIKERHDMPLNIKQS
jgi:hypothetical protein